jgi:hypothetical protein
MHNSYSILYVVKSNININTSLCFQRTKHIENKVECLVRKQRLCYIFVEDSNIEIFLITSKNVHISGNFSNVCHFGSFHCSINTRFVKSVVHFNIILLFLFSTFNV